MREIGIMAIILIATIAMAFELQPIDIARMGRITPGPVDDIETPDSLIIEAALARPIILFDLPDGFLDEDNLIMEAILIVNITPDIAMVAAEPLTAYCVPITNSVLATPTWSSLSSAYDLDYGEFGVYDPDEGTIFFEISRMLYAATDDEIEFYGVMLISAHGSPGFTISAGLDPIDFSVAWFPGSKEVRD